MLGLTFPSDGGHADLDRDDANFVDGDPIETAVALSLFTDAAAGSAEEAEGRQPRGWWADQFFELPLGSRLWLLRRDVDTAATLRRAEKLASEALAWLVDQGVAKAVTISAERAAPGVLRLTVVIERLDGQRWKRSWEVHSNAV